jgi:hypoxanthine phosphoribosyltransferase
MDAADMGSGLKEVLITSEQLSRRTAELAAQIDADYAGREILLVGVLKGAVMVMADLARAMRPRFRWTGWPCRPTDPGPGRQEWSAS